MFHKLQSLTMPNVTFGAPEDMYVRCLNDNVRCSFEHASLDFKDGGVASFDTFFNSLSAGVWRKYCQIESLWLSLRGRGKFMVRFGLRRPDYDQRWLEEITVDLNNGIEILIECKSWSRVTSGMLYFTVEAVGGAALEGGSFQTLSAPVQPIKLGIVITHYDRKKYVLPAIARMREQLLSEYKGRIELVVVDNSKNISPAEAGDVTLIPNRNLGGSGGFTRGLLHLKDEGGFTHCLFMDDDASCEIESIKRCYDFLSFSNTPKLAFAGSLLRENAPSSLHEKGGGFHGMWRALRSGLDMSKVEDLLVAERDDVKVDYGAWWFFAFAIRDVEHMAFPFFVRGDDAMFGLQNKFQIATMNGVGCWGEDFWLKESPLTRYLGARATFLLMMEIGKFKFIPFIRVVFQWYIVSLFSYNYESARAVRLALSHFCEGPRFWTDNIDTVGVRAEIGKFCGPEGVPLEKLRPMNLGERRAAVVPLAADGWRRLLRVVTVNGLLVPSFMMRQGPVYQPKTFRGVFRQIFRFKKVVYFYDALEIGYETEHDKKKMVVELFLFMKGLLRLAWRFGELKRDYARGVDWMTSEAFWREVYSGEATPDCYLPAKDVILPPYATSGERAAMA